MSPGPALAIADARKVLGERAVVDGASLPILKHSFLGLIGQKPAGRSALVALAGPAPAVSTSGE